MNLRAFEILILSSFYSDFEISSLYDKILLSRKIEIDDMT